MARLGFSTVLVCVSVMCAILGVVDSQPKVNPLVVSQQFLWESKRYTYRIPVITQTPGGALIALAEGRKYNSGDTGSKVVEIRRSTNLGSTWSPPVTILTDTQFKKGVNLGTVIVSNDTGVIFMWFEHCMDEQHACDRSTPFLMNSTDDGLTWNKPRDMSGVVGGAKKFVTGPGLGIQKKLLPYKGRLITCGHGDHLSDGVFCVVSDDNGASWRMAGEMQSIPFGRKKLDGDFNPDESQIVELPDGSLMVNMRNQLHYHCRCRAVMRSTDGGETFPLRQLYMDDTLVDSAVQASMLFHRGVLFFANPASPTTREDFKLRWSLDNGTTWPGLKTLWTKSAGYSCMTVHDSVDGAFLFILYEKGTTSDYQWIEVMKLSIYGHL
ncbi:PREDICTED: sialidase-1-like [Branchiostoma belcheri]|uniref:Sialidase-1 n=1 Tax=Branchiostoma belcheri TaxID=7741 RepID=A0A6P5A1V8_BRABE|nr:PREDICTED: sialidase-1-like [Branchiostoma belcheri]